MIIYIFICYLKGKKCEWDVTNFPSIKKPELLAFLTMLICHKRAAVSTTIQLNNPPLHHHKETVTYVANSSDAITHFDCYLSLGCVLSAKSFTMIKQPQSC